MNSRRDLLKTIAALPAVASAASGPRAFTADQFALLTRVVGLIMPRSDTPGAVEAGVHNIIDSEAAAKAGLKREVETALREIDGLARTRHKGAFAELSEQQQIAVLQLGGRGFEVLKALTLDGYYSTREGLVQELGYKGNTFLHEFPGCTHKEHQV